MKSRRRTIATALWLRRDAKFVRIVRSRSKKPQWNADRRLRVALANNNHGLWYVCTATHSVRDIERKFMDGSVASVLYKTVGGVLGDHKMLKHTGRTHYLYVQLTRTEWDVRTALNEIGLDPVGPVAFSAIRCH